MIFHEDVFLFPASQAYKTHFPSYLLVSYLIERDGFYI